MASAFCMARAARRSKRPPLGLPGHLPDHRNGAAAGLSLALVDATGLDLLVLEGDASAIHQALDRVLFPADRVRLAGPQPASLLRLVGPLPQGVPARAAGQWQPLPGPGEGLLLQPEASLGGTAGSPALLLRPGQSGPSWLGGMTPLEAGTWTRWRLAQGFQPHRPKSTTAAIP
jgi:hypothetical protein